jgi:hypothetical protein
MPTPTKLPPMPKVGEVYRRLAGARRPGLQPGDLVLVTKVRHDSLVDTSFLILRIGVETSLPWFPYAWERVG